MVTLIKYGALSGGEKYNVNVLSLDGLSTDTKPTVTFIEYGGDGREVGRTGITNGSLYTEIDTGDTYMYDADNTTWHKVSIGGGGGGTQGGIILVGETTTQLVDNATTNPITVDGQSYAAQPNDAVIYGNKEFLFDGTKWHEFGDLSGLSSKDIGAMTNYVKAQTGAAIATTDTLNEAIGKVEKRIDVNETNISLVQTLVEGTRTPKSLYTRMNAYISGGKTIASSQYPFSFYIAVTNNIKYTIKKPLGTSAFRITFTDSKPVLNMQLASYIDAVGEKEITVTATGAYMFVTISFSEELSILEDIYASIQIYTDRSGSLEERVEKLENVPFDKIRVASYNTGNFTGEGLDDGSTECKLAYRKAIGEVGADLFGLQEDTQYFYDDEDTYPSIYSMYKYYQREGQYEKNFKAFLSNYHINNVKQVLYENRTNMSHYYFLVGELVIHGKTVLVASVHYDWSDITRRRNQISQVIAYANNYDRAIIIGDNNPYDYTDGNQNSDNSLHEVELGIWEAAGYTPANAGYFGAYNTDIDAHTRYNKTYPCDNIIVTADTIKINNMGVVQETWMDDHAILWADLAIY